MTYSGHLFWTALYDDGSVVKQLNEDGERSALCIDRKRLRRFILHTLDGMCLYNLWVPPGHSLIFRRRVTLSYAAGPAQHPGAIDGKTVHYMVGTQDPKTGLMTVEVLSDVGQVVRTSDRFIKTDPLLRSPAFLPQEGIVEPRHGYVLFHSGGPVGAAAGC